MRKSLKALVAALTLTGVMVGAAAPADAQRYRGPPSRHNSYNYNYRGHNDDAAIAIVAGIAGLAIGAAIADGDHNRRDPRYDPRYDGRYDPRYDRGYYDEPRICVEDERVYDRVLHRDVLIRREYRC